MEHRAPDYMDVNPQGLVPALVERAMSCSTEPRHPRISRRNAIPSRRFLPGDAVERAYMRGLAQIIACDIHPLNNIRVLKWLKTRWGAVEDETNQWYAPLDRGRLSLLRGDAGESGRHGTLLPRRHVHHGGYLPRAAGRQCPPLQLRSGQLFRSRRAIADRAAKLPAFQAVAPGQHAGATPSERPGHWRGSLGLQRSACRSQRPSCSCW